jgi:O-antigen/teichoic acid export membrane protein
MQVTSFGKRYSAKLGTNIVGFIFGIVTATIVPRSLGPTFYGNYSFLVNIFTQIFPFLTMNTEMGFYTKLSQRQNETTLITFYLYFTSIAIGLILLFVEIMIYTGYNDFLWINQSQKYIRMAAFYSALIWILRILTYVVDAYGLTIYAEYSRLVQRVIGLGFILFLFFSNSLNLTTLFLQHYVISIALIIVLLIIINKKMNRKIIEWRRIKRHHLRSYVREFYEYSHPLFLSSFIVMCVGIFDRYILQYYGGGVQQGYFGLSLKISTVFLLFTSSMTSLLTRELSISFRGNRIEESKQLFRKYVPLLYSISAFLASYFFVHAKAITFIMAGAQYESATTALMIMTLYPVHQTYGQLASSVLFASGETKIFRNVIVASMLLGLPVTYLLLAPACNGGLNYGALGLAVKFVGMQLFSVNILLYYVTRILRTSYSEYLFHQILSLSNFILISLATKYLLMPYFVDDIPLMMVSGIVYVLACSFSVYLFPTLIGMKREDLNRITNYLKNIKNK